MRDLAHINADLISIQKAVIKIISGHLGLQPSELHLEDNLFDDLGADLLDQRELIITVEEKFRIRLQNSYIADIRTINDIVDAIHQHLQNETGIGTSVCKEYSNSSLRKGG